MRSLWRMERMSSVVPSPASAGACAFRVVNMARYLKRSRRLVAEPVVAGVVYLVTVYKRMA